MTATACTNHETVLCCAERARARRSIAGGRTARRPSRQMSAGLLQHREHGKPSSGHEANGWRMSGAMCAQCREVLHVRAHQQCRTASAHALRYRFAAARCRGVQPRFQHLVGFSTQQIHFTILLVQHNLTPKIQQLCTTCTITDNRHYGSPPPPWYVLE